MIARSETKSFGFSTKSVITLSSFTLTTPKGARIVNLLYPDNAILLLIQLKVSTEQGISESYHHFSR